MASVRRSGRSPVDELHTPNDRAAAPLRPLPHTLGPDDIVPRLIAWGADPDVAARLRASYHQVLLTDALDALEELDARRRVRNPIGWLTAAAEQRWDLTALLSVRREREARLTAWEADQRHRARADDAHLTNRAVAARWDTTVSSALDDDQLTRAIDALSGPVPGVGRHSVPVARAALLAWAIGVHHRTPGVELGRALTADLDHGPVVVVLPDGPLPEPPAGAGRAADEVEPLSVRIAALLAARAEMSEPTATSRRLAMVRELRFGQEFDR